jgi:micrococcal nuclease
MLANTPTDGSLCSAAKMKPMKVNRTPSSRRRRPFASYVLVAALLTGCTSPNSSEQTSPVRLFTGDPASAEALPANAVVAKIVDGDTLDAQFEGAVTRVRLIGVDTPESVDTGRAKQCYGAEASRFLADLIPVGTNIVLVRDADLKDRYGRLLAYVVRAEDQFFINLALIESGYAATMFFEPNTKFEQQFTEAERVARETNTGLWGVCGGPDVPLD